MFFLYVNSARLDEEVRKTLEKKSYFLISISGEVAGDIQGNDTNYYHPVKAIYCEYEMKLILEKLRENPKNISTIQRWHGEYIPWYMVYRVLETVADLESSRGMWFFSKMGTKIFEIFLRRSYANIKPTDSNS